MSDNSNIEWTDATWPVVVGCTKKSAGCANCCAIRDAVRLAGNPHPKIHTIYRGLVERQTNGLLNWTGQVRCIEGRLEIPLHWKKPRRIFVPYMGDLFHPAVPFDFIDKVFAVMALCTQHTFQVLTKEAERMCDYMQGRDWSDAANYITDRYIRPLEQGLYFTGEIVPPLPNVQLCVSAEDQKTYDERSGWLLRTPAAVRGLSCEPLLGEIDLRLKDYPAFKSPEERIQFIVPRRRDLIHWVIVGGESGARARPMHPAWARSIRDQCESAGVRFFFKQWGEYAFALDHDYDLLINTDGTILNGVRMRATEAPMKRVGKKRAGRLLDGREHNEFPEVNHVKQSTL